MTIRTTEALAATENAPDILAHDFIPHVNDHEIAQRVREIQSTREIEKRLTPSPGQFSRIPLDKD